MGGECVVARRDSDANLSLPAFQGDFQQMQQKATFFVPISIFLQWLTELSSQPILQGEV